MLGSEPIFDADAGKPGPVGDLLEPRILPVGRAEDEAAHMEMEIDADRVFGRDDSDGERRSVRSRNGSVDAARRTRRLRNDPARAHIVEAGLGEPGTLGTLRQRRVERARLLAHRLRAEQGRVDDQRRRARAHAATLRKASSSELVASQLLISGITVAANMRMFRTASSCGIAP